MVGLPGTDLSVSAFCYGTAGWRENSETDIGRLYEQFREAGGNFFDSAHIYSFWAGALGEPERLLGRFVRRDQRDKIVIATKGGHPAMKGYERPAKASWPEMIRSDIRDSLERLQLDHIDLYFLHRDDMSVPVSEIIDCLADEVAAGRIRYIAGSNWSSKRFAAANAYAQRTGKPRFVASQPMWNLAHFIAPESWDHTHQVLNDDPAEIEWYAQNNFPAVPFAPTANGGFADPSRLKKQYDNAITCRRLEASQTIAKEIGASANQVALAWLRQHPFPVIPILGTTKADHLADALQSARVTMTTDHLARLS
jgi:aryl-alcohol dehydrogenase-like predicted oxidoreductase